MSLTGSVGQSGAALGATAGKHLPTILGGHSLAESVNLLTMQLLGLIGTFGSHTVTPPFLFARQAGSPGPDRSGQYPERSPPSGVTTRFLL